MEYNLKNEEEVKEFIENLGTEYRFGCYHEKKPDVCHLLADYLEAIKKDWTKAAQLYRVSCDDYKWGHSCFKAGNYHFTGKGGLKEDHTKAYEYYEKGCDLKYPQSCLHAGLMKLSNESKISKDHKVSHKFFEQGCTLKNALSCFYVSGMFISGIPNFLEKDMKKAFQFAEQACELGNVQACANLSRMYKKGDGVTKDEEKSEEYRKRVLDMQDQLVKQFRTITFEEGG